MKKYILTLIDMRDTWIFASTFDDDNYRIIFDSNDVDGLVLQAVEQLESCPEPYIDEDELIKEILRYINFMNMAHPWYLNLAEKMKTSTDSYLHIREEVLYDQDINSNSTPIDTFTFARYIC